MLKTEKIQGLPWYYQFAIFAGVALVVYFGFWYFVTSGTRAEAKELSEKVAVLQGQNAQAQIASQRLNEFKAAYKARQEEYDDLKALLPEQRELTNVLQGLQDRAHNSRLTLIRFSPKDDVQQDFYSGKPIEVEVTSSFGNLRNFFDQMAHYQRIVSITDFDVKQLVDQTAGKSISSKFTLTAYYASAEKLQQKPPAPTPAATASATPATATPAAPTATAPPAAK